MIPSIEVVIKDIERILEKTDSKGLTREQIIGKLAPQGELFNKGKDEKERKEYIKVIKDALYQLSADPDSSVSCKRGVYRTKMEAELPEPPVGNSGSGKDTNFIGRAGEYAVMTEYLMRGYNATLMTVDEGIDIVASKDNKFTFVQVKTTHLDQNLKASVKISKASFDNNRQHNVVYVIALREDVGRFRFLVIAQNIIEFLHSQNVISLSGEYLLINVKYKHSNGKPYLYHGTHEADVFLYQNAF